MNFEKILAENLLRFGVKNLDMTQLRRFLTEQDQASLIQALKDQGEAYKMFRAWEQQTSGLVKLVKTFGYRTIEPRIQTVTVPFFNNFVTIDQGSSNPAAMKAAIDTVLAELQQAGANLDSPTTTIDIISTATQPPAGANIDKAAAAAGRKTIDHNYGISGDIKTALGDRQKSDPQWGNKILAQKRGESAKAYIVSKGIKAKINVIVKIEQLERMFQIVAKVTGQEKFVMPIDTPTPKVTLTFSMAPTLVSQAASGVSGGGVELYNVNVPALRVRWDITSNFGVKGSNTTVQARAGANRGWVVGSGIGHAKNWEAGTKPGDYYSGGGNPFYAMSGEEVAGISPFPSQANLNMQPEVFLSSIGHFTNKQARQLLWEMWSAVSPIGSKLLGIDIAGQCAAYAAYLKQNGVTGAGDILPRNALASFKVDSKKFEIPVKTVEVTLDQLVAAVGGSPELSTNVQYWGQAVYYDSTVTPPTYGSIVKNPTFFDGVRVVQK
jgi:hypothetical protein